MNASPKSSGVTESVLYVDDLAHAVAFYTELLSVHVVREHERFAALRLTNDQVLILFVRGASTSPTVVDGGTIAAHDGAGPHHICFGMAADEVGLWEERMRRMGIAIESQVKWPSGALSLYFRDPDGHAVELATPGIWS